MTRQTHEHRLGDFWLSKRPGRPQWHITWFDRATRQTRRLNTRTDDHQVANRLLAEHYIRFVDLENEEPSEISLQVILDRYYREHAVHVASAEQAKYAIQALHPHVRDLAVADFNKATQQRVFDRLVEEGKSRSYVSRIFSVVKAAVRRAHGQGELSSVPPFIPLPKAKSRDRILSVPEAAALLLAARSRAMSLYLILAFTTGARPGAILELSSKQIDLNRSLINFNPPGREQNNKRRPTLPTRGVLANVLASIGSGLVVSVNGTGYTRDGWRSTFNRTARRASLQGVTAYTIRHTVATELHRRGVPPAEVSAYLGHSAVSAWGITGRYLHFQPDYLHNAAMAADAHLVEVIKEAHRQIALGKTPITSIEGSDVLLLATGEGVEEHS